MGFWDYIYSAGDRVKGITPDLSTVVKDTANTAYIHTSAAVAKIDLGIQKLPEYLPDDEARARIGLFSTTFAKNAGNYALSEGHKLIPGNSFVKL